MKRYVLTAAILAAGVMGAQHGFAATWGNDGSGVRQHRIVVAQRIGPNQFVQSPAPPTVVRSRSYYSGPVTTRARSVAVAPRRRVYLEPIGERTVAVRRTAALQPAPAAPCGGTSWTLVNPGWPYARPYGGTAYQTTSLGAPPFAVTRAWDPDREYVWQNQHYHRQGGTWVVISGNYGDPYAYAYPGASGGYYATSRDLRYAPTADVITTPAAPAPIAEALTATQSVSTEVQTMLARAGYYFGAIDGVLGPQTRSAISAYQADHGLAITGRVNESLLRALGLT